LPYYEEETFSRDSWLAVLLGQGVRPRRTDPLADIVPTDKAAEALAAYRNSLGSFVAAQPLYHDAMSNLGHSA
jgi:tryptophan halogenase